MAIIKTVSKIVETATAPEREDKDLKKSTRTLIRYWFGIPITQREFITEITYEEPKYKAKKTGY